MRIIWIQERCNPQIYYYSFQKDKKLFSVGRCEKVKNFKRQSCFGINNYVIPLAKFAELREWWASDYDNKYLKNTKQLIKLT